MIELLVGFELCQSRPSTGLSIHVPGAEPGVNGTEEGSGYAVTALRLVFPESPALGCPRTVSPPSQPSEASLQLHPSYRCGN